MPRFIYSGHGLALGGHVSRPMDHHIEPHAACVLPSTGGRAVTRSGPYRLADPKSGELILSFDSADTALQGEETAVGVHSTVVTSTLTNINVLNVLHADAIIARLSLVYTMATGKVAIDTEGSRFENLSIGGRPLKVDLDHGLSREAADYVEFRGRHPEHAETRGVIRTSLGRHTSLRFEPHEQGWHHEPNFGRIYFAEWSARPGAQGLTMLRLQLGSPVSAELCMASGDGNGQPYP